MLRLITTGEPRLESEDELPRGIDEAARYIPIRPQCGFALAAAGNLISMDDQSRKLEWG